MAVLIPGRLLFLRTQHTASTAVMRALMEVPGAVSVSPGHVTWGEICSGGQGVYVETGGPNRGPDPRKVMDGKELRVTTQRNPYDLIASWYERTKYRHQGCSMVEFVSDLDVRAPQYLKDGKILWHNDDAQVVMRYEYLRDDFENLLVALDLPWNEIAVVNSTPGKKKWESYFDQESLAVVNDRFGDEIVDAGYLLRVAEHEDLDG